MAIQTEKRLIEDLKIKGEYTDITFNVSNEKFYCTGTCIDRHLVMKLLKEGQIKYLCQEHKSLEEFLVELALGTLHPEGHYLFYHVKFGIWRSGIQYYKK